MKKTLIALSIIVGVLALGVGIFYLSNYLNQPSKEEVRKAKEQMETSFNTPEVDMSQDEKSDLEKEFPDDMNEKQMQDFINVMSHQKVKADAKFGVYELTQERVERLLEVVELNKSNYTNGELYVSILTRWSQNDFSQAVEDHNSIWRLQGGNMGRATELMTPVEEREYIEEHFKNKTPLENGENNEKNI